MLAARKGQVRRMFRAFWESSLPWMGSEQPPLWGAFPPGNMASGTVLVVPRGQRSLGIIDPVFCFFQDPYNILAPKATSGTKEDPNLVPSISNKRIVGCICKCLSTIFLPFCLFAYLFFDCAECGIIVPQSAMSPTFPVVEVQSQLVNHQGSPLIFTPYKLLLQTCDLI